MLKTKYKTVDNFWWTFLLQINNFLKKNWLQFKWIELIRKKSEGIRALWVLRIWKLNFIMLLCNCITVQSVLRFKFVSFDSVWVWVCDEKSMIKSKIVKVHAYDMKQLWVGTKLCAEIGSKFWESMNEPNSHHINMSCSQLTHEPNGFKRGMKPVKIVWLWVVKVGWH